MQNILKTTVSLRHKWLNEQNEFEAAYVKAMGGHKVSHSDQYRYFTISETTQHELIRATNELHLMYFANHR